MIKVNVCIGSSCHLKGSRQVIEKLQSLIAQNHLENEIELIGTFCMGDCTHGVCLKMNETVYSVCPETIANFFVNEVLAALNR